MLLAFGVDADSAQLSGWGGAIEKGEDVFEAAARELREESLDLFTLTAQYVREHHYIRARTQRTTCFFLQVPLRVMLRLPGAFHNRYRSQRCASEMSGVRLVFLRDLQSLIHASRDVLYEIDREMMCTAWNLLVQAQDTALRQARVTAQ